MKSVPAGDHLPQDCHLVNVVDEVFRIQTGELALNTKKQKHRAIGSQQKSKQKRVSNYIFGEKSGYLAAICRKL